MSNPGELWRSQPPEKFVTRRTRDLRSTTRVEILSSFGAAIFFVAIVAWRVEYGNRRFLLAASGLVAAWILGSMYRLRRRLWPPAAREDALASSCLDYYRRQLADRRDHLRSEWLWHGPLLLACLLCFTAVFRNALFGYSRLGSILPLIGLLVAWVGFGVWRRRRQANELQREMDELTDQTRSS